MTKAVLASLCMVFACHGHSDHAKDKPSVVLPVPTKLPPVGSAHAGGSAENHAAEIDNEYATLLAMYNAPAGATPCESVYNAVTAEQAAAKQLKRDSVFSFVAPQADFMKLCNALPATTQQCLVPKYQSTHAQQCEGVNPTDADLAKLYALRKDLEPPKESGQMPPSPER